eukprot:364793-Chlamydomonas_euryale.AAC.3
MTHAPCTNARTRLPGILRQARHEPVVLSTAPGPRKPRARATRRPCYPALDPGAATSRHLPPHQPPHHVERVAIGCELVARPTVVACQQVPPWRQPLNRKIHPAVADGLPADAGVGEGRVVREHALAAVQPCFEVFALERAKAGGLKRVHRGLEALCDARQQQLARQRARSRHAGASKAAACARARGGGGGGGRGGGAAAAARARGRGVGVRVVACGGVSRGGERGACDALKQACEARRWRGVVHVEADACGSVRGGEERGRGR